MKAFWQILQYAGVVAMVSLPCSSSSQERLDSGLPFADSLARRNTASILFERNLNTFNWAGAVWIDTAAFGNRIRLSENFTSNIILLEAAGSPPQRLRSDHNQMMMQIQRPIDETVALRGQWSSLVYSDRKAVGLSTASINSVLGGFDYAPVPWLVFSPLAGHRWDNQIDVRDRGLSYLIGARTRNVDIDGYQIAGSAQVARDMLDPRVLERHFARFGAQKTFLGRTRDSLETGFSRTRREFYTSASGALESRSENIFSLVNLLDYEFEKEFLTSFFVSVYSRSLKKDYRPILDNARAPAQYNTGIDELRLDAYVQGVYRSDAGPAASLRFSHSERAERHFARGAVSGFVRDTSITPLTERQAQDQEQTKDNLARRTSLAGTLEWPASYSDTLWVSGATSILRYDTPSEANVEDRDELLVAVSLSSSHQVSQYLHLTLTLDGNLNQIVYLFGERSANNNINRVLRFSPRALYKPLSFLTIMNRFEVLANYTVYDFEELAGDVRSFSYRQFAWVDSTSLELSGSIGLDFFLYLKLYDRGQLNWREFKERRENSFADKTYAVQVRYKPEPGMLFALGLRYFSQTRYAYSGEERSLDSFLRSVGPTCIILWQVSPYSEVGLRGWYEHRRLADGATQSLANMTLNINITL